MIYKQNRDHEMLLGKENPTGQRQIRDLFHSPKYHIETLKNTKLLRSYKALHFL